MSRNKIPWLGWVALGRIALVLYTSAIGDNLAANLIGITNTGNGPEAIGTALLKAGSK